MFLVTVQAARKEDLEELADALRSTDEGRPEIERIHQTDVANLDHVAVAELGWKLAEVISGEIAKQLIAWIFKKIEERKRALLAGNVPASSSEPPILLQIKGQNIWIRGDVDLEAVRATLESTFGVKA